MIRVVEKIQCRIAVTHEKGGVSSPICTDGYILEDDTTVIDALDGWEVSGSDRKYAPVLEAGEIIGFEPLGYEWYKNNDTDKIWWKDIYDRVGLWVFSFDKVKEYNMFRDYPYKLTEEEIEIFDRENPHWAEFFSDRKGRLNEIAKEKGNSWEDNGKTCIGCIFAYGDTPFNDAPDKCSCEIYQYPKTKPDSVFLEGGMCKYYRR